LRIIARRNKANLQVVAIGVTTQAIKSTEQQRPNKKGNRERVDEFRRIVRQQTVLVGTFLLALSVILSGCSGSVTQEQKREKIKMLKKKEETDKVEKTEK
jgi:hypothetical protein